VNLVGSLGHHSRVPEFRPKDTAAAVEVPIHSGHHSAWGRTRSTRGELLVRPSPRTHDLAPCRPFPALAEPSPQFWSSPARSGDLADMASGGARPKRLTRGSPVKFDYVDYVNVVTVQSLSLTSGPTPVN
jgi:hypothetical protein